MLLRLGSLSVEFNLLNPLYAFAPFVLLLVSIPLAIFAILTTSMAVAMLSFRALIVYFQLGIALVGAWMAPSLSVSPSKLQSRRSAQSSKRSSPTRQRQQQRRSSNTSAGSQDTVTPAIQPTHLHGKSGSFTSLIGTSEITRDFEGIGGWRFPGDSDEEALWIGLNSRLQLPATVPARRHKRSLTGGASPSQRWSWSPEAFRMSPVQSRVRTPVRFAVGDENGYFPPQPLSNIRPMSTASDPIKHHQRKKSGSASSGSSTASTSGLCMVIREAGE